MENDFIHINAFDCLPFDDSRADADVLQKFIESQKGNIFWFSDKFHVNEDSKLAEYDYRANKWVAGRYVGEAFFDYKGLQYKITVKPRFGEKVLFRMLEEIFNIRLSTSTRSHSVSDDWQHYIKKIIAFIWLQKLANTNLHGLPKSKIVKTNRGKVIKGKLEIRKSINPYYVSNEIISTSNDKQLDNTIAQIIFQAYNIINSDFLYGDAKIPDTAQDALNQVFNFIKRKEYISDAEYKSIRYKEIYMNWKPLVDLSWDIIKRKQLSLKQKNKETKAMGFFIDMAEIWEQYLKTILKKHLSPYGWHLRAEKAIAYKSYFFRRELIPDIVFQNKNNIAVWDAKYKGMRGLWYDIDRSDFFQIHTYILNYLQHFNVRVGGLLYPILKEADFRDFKSPYLMNEAGTKMDFIIDGIIVKEVQEDDAEKIIQHHKIQEMDFINRILSHLQ